MAVWEYSVITIKDKPAFSDELFEKEIEQELALRGKEGWELVSINDFHHEFSDVNSTTKEHRQYFAIFKRPIG